MYKLGKDMSLSGWREVAETSASLTNFLCKFSGELSQGFIYWLALLKHDCIHGMSVLSFDIHEEKFETVSLPSRRVELGLCTGLVPWRKSIAWYRSSTDETTIGVWVMSAEKRWTKYLSIPSAHGLAFGMHPKALWKNGDEILTSDRSYNNLVSYNVVENKCRLIYINSAHTLGGGALVPYLDSSALLLYDYYKKNIID